MNEPATDDVQGRSEIDRKAPWYRPTLNRMLDRHLAAPPSRWKAITRLNAVDFAFHAGRWRVGGSLLVALILFGFDVHLPAVIALICTVWIAGLSIQLGRKMATMVLECAEQTDTPTD